MSYENWVFLSGKTKNGVLVTLRPLHINDADLIGLWRNNEELRQLLGVDSPVTHEEVCAWLKKKTSSREANPEDISLGVCVEGRFVGTAGIHEISLRHRHGTFGIYIGNEKVRGQGVGGVVYDLLLKYSFRELDLRAVCAHVYGHNEPSKRLHLSKGFQQVGCIPEWQFRDGADQDFLTYSISQQQWLAPKK